MKKLLLYVAILIFVAGLSSQPTRADLILNPTDDTYIVEGSNNNYNENALIAEFTKAVPCNNTSITYLRFDVSSLPEVGEQTQVRLYIVIPPITSETLALWSTGDDWNGGEAGLGDEETLNGNNEPAPIALLDTKPSGIDEGWVEFSGSELSNYINAQRPAPDGLASFLVKWNTCAIEETDVVIFEDTENYTGTGNYPELYPRTPTAITLSAFSASSHIASPWVLVLGVGLLVVILAAAVILRRRSKIAA